MKKTPTNKQFGCIVLFTKRSKMELLVWQVIPRFSQFRTETEK